MHRLLVCTVSVLALTVSAAHSEEEAAESEATTLEEITVSANRTPTEKSKTGSKVELVSE
jgi:outer membrane cobalamin receptor